MVPGAGPHTGRMVEAADQEGLEPIRPAQVRRQLAHAGRQLVWADRKLLVVLCLSRASPPHLSHEELEVPCSKGPMTVQAP